MSVVSAFFNSKEFSKLILKGKGQGFLTPEEINDGIPASIVEYNDVDLILVKLEEMSIAINKVTADEEESELSEIESIDQALAQRETKELKTSSSDPVKLYLKKMGSVALLTREGEVKIAKEIEEGEKEIVLS